MAWGKSKKAKDWGDDWGGSSSGSSSSETNFAKNRSKKKPLGAMIVRVLDAIVSAGIALAKWIWRSLMRLLKMFGAMIREIAELFFALLSPPGIWHLAKVIAWILILGNICTYYETYHIFFGSSGMPMWGWVDLGFLALGTISALVATVGQTIAFDEWSISSRRRKAEETQRNLKTLQVDPNAHALGQYHAKRFNRSGFAGIMRNNLISAIVFLVDGVFNVFPFWWYGLNIVPAIFAGLLLAYLPEWLKNLAKEGLETEGKSARSQSGTTVDTQFAQDEW